MRTKLMLFSAVTCLTGGSALLAPASAEGRGRLPCEELVGTSCTMTFTQCTTDWGGTDTLYCSDGIWNYGW